MKSITQNYEFLEILKQRDVNSHEELRHSYLQMPRIVSDLEKEGCVIDHDKQPNRSVTYRLKSVSIKKPRIIEWRFEGNTAIPIYG